MTYEDKLEVFEKFKKMSEVIGAKHYKTDPERGRQCGRLGLWRFISFPSAIKKPNYKWISSAIIEECVMDQEGFTSTHKARMYLKAKRMLSENPDATIEDWISEDDSWKSRNEDVKGVICKAISKRTGVFEEEIKEEDGIDVSDMVEDIAPKDANENTKQALKLIAMGYTTREIDKIVGKKRGWTVWAISKLRKKCIDKAYDRTKI